MPKTEVNASAMEDKLPLPRLYQPESAADLLPVVTISKVLLGFTAGVDWLAIALQEKNGTRHDLWGERSRYWCEFCRRLRLDLKRDGTCTDWDSKVARVLLGQQAEDYSGQKQEFEGVFRCHAGLLDFAEVIRVGGRPLAVLHGGQLHPSEDPSWEQSVRDRLSKGELALTPGQIDDLILGALGDENSTVTNAQLQDRVDKFRVFAREVEELFNKLYGERRHGSEEALLRAMATRLLAAEAGTTSALWESVAGILKELRSASEFTHAEWFVGSEGNRFHLTARTSATPEWRSCTLSLGAFWEELQHRSGDTSHARWNTNLHTDLGLSDDSIVMLYPVTLAVGSPSRSIPAVFVLACKQDDFETLDDFAARLALQFLREITAALSQIGSREAMRATAAQGAYVGHDIKMPLHVLANAMPSMQQRLKELHMSDARLDKSMDTLSRALDDAMAKASELEKMPVRQLVVKPRPRKTDLVAVLDQIVALAAGLGTPEGITVEWWSRPDEAVMCDLDERYMAVAFRAILDNAVKFSFRNMPVRVSAKVLQGRVEVKVSDLGVGIPPEKLIAIFEFHERGDVEDKRGVERRGSGLGLPFAQRIIVGHHGTIAISSRSSLKPPPDDDDFLSHVVEVTVVLPLAGSV